VENKREQQEIITKPRARQTRAYLMVLCSHFANIVDFGAFCALDRVEQLPEGEKRRKQQREEKIQIQAENVGTPVNTYSNSSCSSQFDIIRLKAAKKKSGGSVPYDARKGQFSSHP
jgi:hypothetical protein